MLVFDFEMHDSLISCFLDPFGLNDFRMNSESEYTPSISKKCRSQSLHTWQYITLTIHILKIKNNILYANICIFILVKKYGQSKLCE